METNIWIKSFAVVTFDEDIGQKVEYQTPVILNDCYQQILAFLAFPDSNSFNKVGTLVYTFKMNYDPPLYGYVYFRQYKDLEKPRKFSQRSLVLLSELPYISLFKQTIEILGPLYFDHGESIFEAVNSCIKSWGNNIPGTTLELPMMGTVIYFSVPSTEGSYSPQLLGDGLSDILDTLTLGHPGLFQDINLCETLGMSFVQRFLVIFWELLISGDSFLFVTDSPETCSVGVFGLVSLISPLIYTGEVFPYFTIFDSDFKSVQNNYERKKLTETVIGATNPYIMKVFGDLPHVFSFEDRNGLHPINIKTQWEGQYKGLMLLEGISKEVYAINNTAIRKYFRELTLSFLHPFQQYLFLDQIQLKNSPFSHSISLKTFVESEFLASISGSRNHLPITKFMNRQKVVSLYSKFIKSSTFVNWFAKQRQKASQDSDRVIRKAMFDFDVSKIFNLDKKERRDLYEKIKGRLAYEEIAGENFEGILVLKHKLQVLGQNIAKVNETI